jgi:hypothetical protein
MTDEQLDSIISNRLVLTIPAFPRRSYVMAHNHPAYHDHKRAAAKVEAAIVRLNAETYKDPLARLDAGEVML